MKYIFKDKKGFSLVELIVTLVLFLILVSFGYLVISAGNNNFDTGTARAHLQHNARLLDDYLQANLGKATSMVISPDIEQLDNTIKLESNIATGNGENITSNVIDDIQFRINSSGDKAVIEYKIMTSGEDEIYEMTSSVALDNIAPSYFEGAFSSFASIKTNPISFDIDIILPMVRKITTTPASIIADTVYDDDTIQFTLELENDELVDGSIQATNFLLAESLSFLEITDITRDDNSQLLKITLGNGKVGGVGFGQILLPGEIFTSGLSLVVNIPVIPPAVDRLEVFGETEIIIPNPGGSPVSREYTFEAYDAEDNVILDEEVNWSLQNNLGGVSFIKNTDGNLTLTITDQVAETMSDETIGIKIIATSQSNPEKSDDILVTLSKQGRSLSDIMDSLTTLEYHKDYTAISRPSWVILPIVSEDVLFLFTDFDGEVELTNDGTQVKINGLKNKTSFGNVTLTGTMNGESVDKLFYFKIPQYNADPVGDIQISTTQFVN